MRSIITSILILLFAGCSTTPVEKMHELKSTALLNISTDFSQTQFKVACTPSDFYMKHMGDRIEKEFVCMITFTGNSNGVASTDVTIFDHESSLFVGGEFSEIKFKNESYTLSVKKDGSYVTQRQHIGPDGRPATLFNLERNNTYRFKMPNDQVFRQSAKSNTDIRALLKGKKNTGTKYRWETGNIDELLVISPELSKALIAEIDAAINRLKSN